MGVTSYSGPIYVGGIEVIDENGQVVADIKDTLAQGSIYIGNASNVTSELAVGGANKFLIGNGTTLVSAALSGEVTNVAGAVTINSDAITTVKILDANVTAGKLAATLDLSAKTVTLPATSVANSMMAVPKVEIYQETFAYSDMTDNLDATGQFDLSYSIPAGSVILAAPVTAITGFTGDTSATFTIGDGSTVDRYNTGTPSCFTTAAAGVSVGAVSGDPWHTAAATPRVTVTGNADFTSISAGQMTVTLFVARPV